MPLRYEIRAVSTADADDLAELASFLDSVNLPHDRREIAPIIEHSEQSFSGEVKDPNKREYRFVLRDLDEDKTIGTSLVVAQLGRRDAPYIYFEVRKEERYSQSLDKHFIHHVLSIGYSYDGPTEIGGLVMHPESRRVKEKLGLQISYVRFLFIAMHRERFQSQLLAELLPPLEADGTSHLWEAVGRRFTDMTYREADRLSKRNKEFIRGLFPEGDIYASLLADDARDVIGRVGPQTKGVEKMLRRVGFRYVDRVDPFDGGPHFMAPTDEVTLVERSALRRLEVAPEVPALTGRALVARAYGAAPWFRAVAVPADTREPVVRVERSTLDHLELADGASAWVLPLD
ncbi:MAG: arginine N-succinyltransferase [Myxococcales bacterium]|nr:arginine N-succinyltransferase [Myxococcales bacterium]